jgi:hypothetical protein
LDAPSALQAFICLAWQDAEQSIGGKGKLRTKYSSELPLADVSEFSLRLEV